MLIDPNQYSKTSPYDLLIAASKGLVGIDQRWVRALAARPEETIPDLLRFSDQDLAAYPIDLEPEIIELFRHFRDSRALPFFLAHMRKAGLEAMDNVLHGLASLGQAAVEPLLELYEEVGENEGGDIAFALAALGVRDDRVLKLLLDRMDFDVIDAAVDLALYGDPTAIEPIQHALAEVPQGESNEYLKRNLEAALRDLHAVQNSMPIPEEEFDIYSLYPETAPPDFDVMDDDDLLELLRGSTDAQTRQNAAKAFFNETLEDSLADQLYQIALQEPEPEVRAELWGTLGMASDNKKIVAALKQRTSADFPPVERAGALIGLSVLGDSPQFAAIAHQLYQKPETRAKALEAMRRTLQPSYAKYFPPHLDDHDAEVKRQAIWGVGYLEIAGSSKRLQQFFESDEFREDAIYAYALSASIKVNEASIERLFEKIEKLAGGFSAEEATLVETALDERLVLNGMAPIFGLAGEFDLDEDLDEEIGEDLDEDAIEILASAAPLPPIAPPLGPRLVPPPAKSKPGRNDPCPCGSNKKYKKCCGA